MKNFKRASISVAIVLGVGILIVSLNRQPDAIGVGASTPVVFSEHNTNVDMTQTNSRISTVENNIIQISEQQQAMNKSLQELIAISKHNIKQSSLSTEQETNLGNHRIEESNKSENLNSPITQQQVVQNQIKDDQQFEIKQSQFYNEPVDDGWRSNEESRLNNIFEDNQLSANNLECRGASWRVELAYKNSSDAADAMDKLIQSMPNSEGEFKNEEQSDGSTKTILIIKPGSN
jgi:hypothetical protein